MVNQQRFSFGYHLNTWDLGGLSLTAGIRSIGGHGFGWVEALARDAFSNDFARRFMQTGPQPVPVASDDIDFLSRLQIFADSEREGLRLSSLYCNREFVNSLTWSTELSTLSTILRILSGFGSPGIVLGGGPPARGGADHTGEKYDVFVAALHDVGRRAADLGMWVAYHPHIDCFVENREQLDKVMDRLDTSLAGLCIDTAHLAISGSDPVAAIRDYASALRYVHFKDVIDPNGVDGVDRYLAFRALGSGVVNLKGCAEQLLRDDYDGIVIVELDTTTDDPDSAIEQAVNYIRDELALQLSPGDDGS